ncbi:MAG TPA: TonB-dependent receptor [Gammaproteobacteria bacterium]
MQKLITALLLVLAGPASGQPPLEEIIVRGEFRDTKLDELPASVSVLDAETIEGRSARHLEEVLALIPNVNLAGGSARSRFFQIRGIGERGQFAEPFNPSVGVLVDGVDLSTAANAATLFDVEQIEVFRGPQGTRYGANALAGVVNVRTNAPTEAFEARAGLEAANYDALTLDGAVSGPLAEHLGARLAVLQHSSDGFTDNLYLGRTDTTERDELSMRGKLRWLPTDDITVETVLGRIDVDDGYDAFSLDNDRNTLSDEPGRDAVESTFGSVDIAWNGATAYAVEASVGNALSDSVYGYDEDWTYVGFHPFGYSSTDYYLRDQQTLTTELRVLSKESGRLFSGSTDWVVGVYALDSEEDLTRVYTFFPAPFASEFTIARHALFGELESAVGARTRVTAGVRYEQHGSEYADSAGVAFSPDDDMHGWRLSVDRDLTAALLGYATASRGYKAGGFNQDGTLDADLRQYDPETLLSYELGLKGSFLDARLDARFALFHMTRDDVQIASSITRVRPNGSAEFIEFVGNAAEGTNDGIEAEIEFAVNAEFRFTASVGLLDSEYESFVNSAGQDLDGREQAHAPGYQFAVSGRYSFANGWYLEIGAEGRDAFYFSDSHDERSRAYELVNAQVGFERGAWNLRLWGRNLTDEDYFIRGYYFGNDPRIGYAERGYTQLGEPRRVGVSVSRAFE